MKATFLVKVFFILLVIGSSFQYALMIPAYQAEQLAKEKASLYTAKFNPDNPKIVEQQLAENYLDSISNKVIFSIPYLSQYTYNDLKARQLKLGLDLKGGLRLGISFDMEHFIRTLVQEPDNAIFLKVLDETKQQSPLSPEDFVSNFFSIYQQKETNDNIIQQFTKHFILKSNALLKDNPSFPKLVQSIQRLSAEMVYRTKLMLQHRVDALGLNQAQVSLDESRKLILVEIPGVKNPAHIKKMLLSTAALEFWETYRITDPGILQALLKADQLLKDSELQ